MTQKHIATLPTGATLAVEYDTDIDGTTFLNSVVLLDTEQGDVYLTVQDIWAIANNVNHNKEFREILNNN